MQAEKRILGRVHQALERQRQSEFLHVVDACSSEAMAGFNKVRAGAGTLLLGGFMSESAWQMLMIILAPVVFINLVLFGLLVRAALQISKETKLTDRLKRS